MMKLKPGEIGRCAWGVGAACLIPETRWDFLSWFTWFSSSSSFSKVKVLKFCRPRLVAMLSRI